MNPTGVLLLVVGVFILGRTFFSGSNGKTLAGMLAGSQPSTPGSPASSSSSSSTAGGILTASQAEGPLILSHSTGQVTATHSASFATDILKAIGAPTTPANTSSLLQWINAEGNLPSVDQFNPIDTTQPYAGSISTNSAKVQSFPSWAAGVDATAATLENGYYNEILTSLRNGTGVNPANPTIAQELAKWGTGSDW